MIQRVPMVRRFWGSDWSNKPYDPNEVRIKQPEPPKIKKSWKARLMTRLLGFDPYEVNAELAVIREMYHEVGINGWSEFQRANRLEAELIVYKGQESKLEDFAKAFVSRDSYDVLEKSLKATKDKLRSLTKSHDDLMAAYDRNIIRMMKTAPPEGERPDE